MGKTPVKSSRRQKRKFPDPSILLCPNVPFWLRGLSPREIRGKTWWDRKRKGAYARFDGKCWACGAECPQRGLQAHEIYDYDYERRSAKLREIVALCPGCHSFIHDQFSEVWARQYRTTEKRKRVRRHAEAMDQRFCILKKNRLMEKWHHKDDAYWKSVWNHLADKCLAQGDLSRKTVRKLVESLACKTEESEWALSEMTIVGSYHEKLPRKTARRLIEAGLAILDGSLSENSPTYQVVRGLPNEVVASFMREHNHGWHLVVNGRKYRRNPDEAIWPLSDVSLSGNLDNFISGRITGRITCHGGRVGSGPLRIKVIDRKTNELVGLAAYQNVSKKMLRDGFFYHVLCSSEALSPRDKYLVRAVKKAPGKYLQGEASVTAVAKRRKYSVDIKLLDPRTRRKKQHK